MNIEQARFNMIEQQIRTWEVLDPQAFIRTHVDVVVRGLLVRGEEPPRVAVGKPA